MAPYARIHIYDYNATSVFFSGDAEVSLDNHATTFLAELTADRRSGSMERRPIIFLCHALGGLLVKKALTSSAKKDSNHKLSHLFDVFNSTYGILFFGTPHTAVPNDTGQAFLEMALESVKRASHPHNRGPEITNFRNSLPQIVHQDFSQHTGRFHLYCIWEEQETTIRGHRYFVVRQTAATIHRDDVEQCGVPADHFEMTRLSTEVSPGHKIVLSTIREWSRQAPSAIALKWIEKDSLCNTMKAIEGCRELGIQGTVAYARNFNNQPDRLKSRFPTRQAEKFIGRTQALQKIYDAFFPYGNPDCSLMQKAFVIHGMGGSGKTELSSTFAYLYSHEYLTVQTIDATTEESIHSSLCDIAQAARLERTKSAGLHVLNQLQAPWLLVIDNADDLKIDISAYFTASSSVHVLITTRRMEFVRYGHKGSYKLDTLEEDEALDLFLHKAKLPMPWSKSVYSHAKEITNALGYLAIAVVQAGACIANGACKITRYLASLVSAREQIRRQASSKKRYEDLDRYFGPIYGNLELSLSFFRDQGSIAKRHGLEILHISAFFHFKRIPYEIFRRALRNRKDQSMVTPTSRTLHQLGRALSTSVGRSIALPQFLLDPSSTEDTVSRAIDELQLASLATVDLDDDSFSFHPMTHAWARDSLSVSDHAAWCQIAFNTLIESIALPTANTKLTPEDRRFHANILPHLVSFIGDDEALFSQLLGRSSFWAAAIANLLPQLHILLFRDQVQQAAKCGYVLGERGQFLKAAKKLQVATNALHRGLGMHDERTMTAAKGLAAVYWGLGRLEEAIGLQSSVATAQEHLYGPLHEKTLQTLDSLGYSYWLHGYHFEALDLHEQAVERMKKTLGPKHEATLTALDHLGTTLGSLHRFGERLEIHQQVLLQRKLNATDDHLKDPETLVTLDHIAMALLDLDRATEAMPIISMVHKAREDQLGREHPYTLWCLCNLAKVHNALNQPDIAAALLEVGVKAAERSLSKDHLGTLMGRGELARSYARLGRLDEAEMLTLETIPLVESSRGLAHPDCVYGLYKLGHLYELKKDVAAARKTYETALQRADLRIQRRHPIAQAVERSLSQLDIGLQSQASTLEIATVDASPQFRLRIGQTW